MNQDNMNLNQDKKNMNQDKMNLNQDNMNLNKDKWYRSAEKKLQNKPNCDKEQFFTFDFYYVYHFLNRF